jgi:hypothetical protein
VLSKAMLFSIYTLLGTGIISGLMAYSGRINDLIFYATVKNVHNYSFYGLIIVGFAYLGIVTLYRQKIAISEYKTVGPNWISAFILLISVGISFFLARGIEDFLEQPVEFVSRSINRSPIIDGRASGIEWVGADSLSMILTGGDNFPNGVTELKVKSFHNYYSIFFLFQWPDPEPSFNRSLIKTDSGWIELNSKASPFGESAYYEDQLAISFHSGISNCAQSCHLGGKNRSGSHYTSGDTADFWVWRAVSTNPAFEADDGWWGEKTNDSIGGVHFDNSPGGGYMSNLNREWDEPYFLPSHHIFDNWIWMESNKFIPYRASLDNYAAGSTIPGMLVSRIAGDRGDIYARGQWRNGVWTVELSRSKTTGSPFDITLRESITIGFAIFDNSELKHAYHLKPITLSIEH